LSTRILITGGTGFLGSYIIKELIEKKYTVRALRRSKTLPAYIDPKILDKVEWVDGDILDVVSLEEAMQGMDAVIHSAAMVTFDKRDRRSMYQVNVEGTANVVNIALEQKIKRFVHVSSVASLGRTANGGVVNEEKKWEESKVNTHYAKSKYQGELEAWRGLSEGLHGVIVNPSTILGYGDWNTSSCTIFKRIHHGFNWYTPGVNGFVDVEDAARAIVALMETEITEQRFIINGDNWLFKKLQDTIATSLSKKKPMREATPRLLDIGWRLEKIKSFFSGKRPLLTRDSVRVAKSKTYFDNAKLLRTLPGFSFTPLEKAIDRAGKRYLDNIAAPRRYSE
jgi:nucleoside-diphosphate-sugar epimerase